MEFSSYKIYNVQKGEIIFRKSEIGFDVKSREIGFLEVFINEILRGVMYYGFKFRNRNYFEFWEIVF